MVQFTRMRCRGDTVTFTTPGGPTKVYRLCTAPTDSSEPLWRAIALTAKEAAIEEIRAQPFYGSATVEDVRC